LEPALGETQDTPREHAIKSDDNLLGKSKPSTKNAVCSSAPAIHKNGHFSSSQAKVVRERFGLPGNQCLFSSIPFEKILSQEDIDKSDGFPAQYWQLVKDNRICKPSLITGEKLDVSCRDEKNPVKYYWSGKYKGDEHTEGCESRCQPTENKAEADFLVNAKSKPISKTPGKTQYTVRYAVESIFMDGTPSNHDITMDMSPYSNVPMLYIPDEFYNKLVAMKPPSVEQIKKKKLAVWAASNCGTSSLSWRRSKFAKEISKYMPVDFPGPCNNNIKGLQGRSKWTKNSELYSNYLFVFAFHNSLDNANIDEKFYFPALGNSVPVSVSNDVIYFLSMGNGSFIDATKFSSPKALATYLLYLQKHPVEYLKYFEYRTRPEPSGLRPMYDVLANFEVGPRLKRKVMCRLCSCLCDPRCMEKRKSSECGYAMDWKPVASPRPEAGNTRLVPKLDEETSTSPHTGVQLKSIPISLQESPSLDGLEQTCSRFGMSVCDMEDVAAAWISGYTAKYRGWTKSRRIKFAPGCKRGRNFGGCKDTLNNKGKLKSAQPVAIGQTPTPEAPNGLNAAIDKVAKGVFCCASYSLPQPKLNWYMRSSSS
jgi:hypothetical protein